MRSFGTIAVLGFATLIIVSAASADRQRSKRYVRKGNDFVVVCTLFNGPAPGATTATPTEPITFDPRFVVGARIERITTGKSPWKRGDRVNFVIHSPSRMLPRKFAGMQFVLTFSPFRPTTEDDKVWFEPRTKYLLRWIEPFAPPKSPPSN